MSLCRFFPSQLFLLFCWLEERSHKLYALGGCTDKCIQKRRIGGRLVVSFSIPLMPIILISNTLMSSNQLDQFYFNLPS